MILLSALVCAACTDADWAHVMPGSSQSEFPPPSSSAVSAANYAAFAAQPAGPAATQKCMRAARDRRSDTEQQGFDDTTQQQVYDKTYTNCMVWAAKGVVR